MSRSLPLAGDRPAPAIPRTAMPTAHPIDALERRMPGGPAFAWGIIMGLPVLGVVTPLFFGLSPFAAFLSGSFLLATRFVLLRALVRFTSQAMPLRVAARLVLVLVVGAMRFCLVGDRLLGRPALNGISQFRKQQR